MFNCTPEKKTKYWQHDDDNDDEDGDDNDDDDDDDDAKKYPGTLLIYVCLNVCSIPCERS